MDGNKKDSFIVHAAEIKEVIDELSDAQTGKLFRAMIEYQLTGEEYTLPKALKMAFVSIRAAMDRNNRKYKEKCERMRENANRRWNDANDAIASNCMQIDYERERDNERERDSDSERDVAGADIWALSRSVLSHLNQAAGTLYRTDDADSVRLISELAHKGYTEEQMQDVIDRKCREWLGDPKMEHYLRPSTLFKPANFEKYLAAPDSARKKQQEKDELTTSRLKEKARRIKEETRQMEEEHERLLKEYGLR